MTRRLRKATILFALAISAAWATGCAVGRNEATGSIVLGFDAGKLVETTDQAIGALGEGLLGALGVAVPGAGVIGIMARRFITNARENEKRIREEADKAYDEAAIRTAATYQPPPPVATSAAGATT